VPVGPGEGAVEIDLARREACRGLRPGAEAHGRRPVEPRRPGVRPVHEGKVVECRAGRRGLELGGRPPRRGDRGGAVRERGSGGARHRHGSFETRRAAVRPPGSLGIERERRGRRVDGEVQLDPAIVAAMAAVQPERRGAARRREGAVALERTEQRPHFAGEAQILERDAAAIGGVSEDDAALSHAEMVDADAIGIEPERRHRRLDLAVPAELQRGLDALERQLVHPDVAAHQRAEAQFHPELAGGNGEAPGGVTATPSRCSDAVGSSRSEIGPETWTGAPTHWVARASRSAR